MMCGLYNQKLL